MKILLLSIISVAVLISLLISGWGLYERTSLKIDISNLNNDIEIIKADLKELKSRPAQAAPGRAAPAAQPVVEKVVSIDDDPMKGDPNAPVTIIEFSDYECPFCKRNYDNTLAQIDKEYISKGKVRLVFRDYPLAFHKKAVPAAMAANCAGEQGKYWETHDFLFENPDKLDIPAIIDASGELGLDKDKFEACVNDKSKEAEITKDFKDGQKYGVRGTPSFFIGRTGDGKEFKGTFVRGAQPYSVFKEHIDEQLKEVN
jgi:protein-disulfide isomerase